MVNFDSSMLKPCLFSLFQFPASKLRKRRDRWVSLLVLVLTLLIDHFYPKPFKQVVVLTPDKDIALMVDLDGVLYMVDRDTKKVEWSWSSGSQIHISHRNVSSDEDYVDCGDDWQLYIYRNGTQIKKVEASLEEYLDMIRMTGTIGGLYSDFYGMDAQSGRLLHVSDSLVPNANIKSVKQFLYVIWKTYGYRRQGVWSLSVAEIEAYFDFEGVDSFPEHKRAPIVHRVRDRRVNLVRSGKWRGDLPPADPLADQHHSSLP